MAVKTNLVIDQGADFNSSFTFTDDTDELIDFTSYTANSQIRKTYASTTAYNFQVNLANNGVDLIEIGVPFLDPSGDGPIIENASKRSIARGMNLKKVLELSTEFRKTNHHTPLIMMTYFNPLLKYGLENIFQDVEQAGFDGILIVDLPFEEEQEVVSKIKKTNLDFIRLIAPSTPLARMKIGRAHD